MDHNVLIAGAGLSGRLLALALAHRGLSSTLIDPAGDHIGQHDKRTTAVAYASIRMLVRLGLWDPLEAGAGAINDILVTNGIPRDGFRSGGVTGGALHFPSSLLPDHRRGSSDLPLGYIVENTAMNRVFEDAVAASPLITRRYDRSVANVTRVPGQVSADLDNGETVTGSVLVACDGKASPLRQRLGFRFLTWPYEQKAIAFNIAHTEDHGGVAQEAFYPGGPFAILPMAGKSCSIVWTEKTSVADGLLALDPDAFRQEAIGRIGEYLGDITISTPPGAFPLTFGYVPNPTKERAVLVGDAAHTIHPIAGQGFNLGVKDIGALSDVLAQAHNAGMDIGHGTVLEEYARWRRFDTASMSFGTDALNRLFSNNIAPVRWARSLGLGLVQKIDPLRVALMRQSGADTGSLPTLMQPLP